MLGRPRSLSPKALERSSKGMGYRAIASELRGVAIDVNWSTVRRSAKDQPPYTDPVYDPL